MRIRPAVELEIATGEHWSASLEPLIGLIFSGDRPRGWLTRKIEREHVRPEASPVLVDAGGRPRGYVLLGWPPSLGSTARTAGVGVAPALRGLGHGHGLLTAAAVRARELGASRLRTICPPELVGFYGRAGLQPIRERWTLIAPGAGSSPPPRLNMAWSSAPGLEVAAWLPETWAGTPTIHRSVVRFGPAGTALLTAESGGWLCHRLGLSSDTPVHWQEAATILRHAVPANSHVWLYGCPALGAGPISLLDRGWRVAQRVIVLEGELY